eukprot:GHVP01064552.1.p1 GENE.GHVP01064552.1~~GHVP01064552.1.p1  ORF type:complete len:357 (-),score=71.51 GHVP01064552.1:786-1856(-)
MSNKEFLNFFDSLTPISLATSMIEELITSRIQSDVLSRQTFILPKHLEKQEFPIAISNSNVFYFTQSFARSSPAIPVDTNLKISEIKHLPVQIENLNIVTDNRFFSSSFCLPKAKIRKEDSALGLGKNCVSSIFLANNRIFFLDNKDKVTRATPNSWSKWKLTMATMFKDLNALELWMESLSVMLSSATNYQEQAKIIGRKFNVTFPYEVSMVKKDANIDPGDCVFFIRQVDSPLSEGLSLIWVEREQQVYLDYEVGPEFELFDSKVRIPYDIEFGQMITTADKGTYFPSSSPTIDGVRFRGPFVEFLLMNTEERISIWTSSYQEWNNLISCVPNLKRSLDDSLTKTTCREKVKSS